MTFTDILNSITALLAEANKAEEDPDLKKFYDPVTYYLLNSQTVVIP